MLNSQIPPNVSAKALVEALYFGILGREADPSGLQTFTPLAALGTDGIARLAQLLVHSEEFSELFAKERSIGRPWVTVEHHGTKLVIPEGSELLAELRSPQGYEPWVLPYFLDLLRPGMSVVDFGASLGTFTIPAARRVGPSGKVYAVEVAPGNCFALQRSVQTNALRNVFLLPFAATDKLGFATISAVLATHNFSLHRNSSDTELPEVSLIVPTLPLDRVRQDLGNIDVMKLDIEGAEHLAVSGAWQIISESRPVIFLEYSPSLLKNVSGIEPTLLLDRILGCEYQVEILHRDRSRESLGSLSKDSAVARIDTECKQRMVDGGTHLDLCFSARQRS